MRNELKQEIHTSEADIRMEDEENSRAANWLDGQFDLIQKKEKLASLKAQLNELEQIDARVTELRLKVKNEKKMAKYRRKFQTSDVVATNNDESAALNEGNGDAEDADLVIDDQDIDDADEDKAWAEPNVQRTQKAIQVGFSNCQTSCLIRANDHISSFHRYSSVAARIRSCRRWSTRSRTPSMPVTFAWSRWLRANSIASMPMCGD